MDLNSFLFPAPKRDSCGPELKKHLLWVPPDRAYSQTENSKESSNNIISTTENAFWAANRHFRTQNSSKEIPAPRYLSNFTIPTDSLRLSSERSGEPIHLTERSCGAMTNKIFNRLSFKKLVESTKKKKSQPTIAIKGKLALLARPMKPKNDEEYCEKNNK